MNINEKLSILTELNDIFFTTLTNNEIINAIKNDCSDYLNKTKNKPFVKFTTSFNEKNGTGEGFVIKNRRPKSYLTKLEIKTLNKVLKLYGHNDRNNTLILISDVKKTYNKNYLKSFGIPYVYFPQGNISFTYIKGGDFNKFSTWENKKNAAYFHVIMKHPTLSKILIDKKTNLNNTIEQYITENNMIDIYKENLYFENTNKTIKEIRTEFNNLFVTDRNLKYAFDNSYEIWFKCDMYYFSNDYNIINHFYKNSFLANEMKLKSQLVGDS